MNDEKYICYFYFPNPNRFGASTELVSSRKEAEKWVTRFIKERKVIDVFTLDNKTYWHGYSRFYTDAVCFGINKVEVPKNPADPSSRRR